MCIEALQPYCVSIAYAASLHLYICCHVSWICSCMVCSYLWPVLYHVQMAFIYVISPPMGLFTYIYVPLTCQFIYVFTFFYVFLPLQCDLCLSTCILPHQFAPLIYICLCPINLITTHIYGAMRFDICHYMYHYARPLSTHMDKLATLGLLSICNVMILLLALYL